MVPLLSGIASIGGVIAVIVAALLGVFERKPKSDAEATRERAEATSAAVDDALNSLRAALEQANGEVQRLRVELAGATEAITQLRRECGAFKVEKESLERQLGARDRELSRLRKD
jgi:chromosome segregation ATPase